MFIRKSPFEDARQVAYKRSRNNKNEQNLEVTTAIYIEYHFHFHARFNDLSWLGAYSIYWTCVQTKCSYLCINCK